MYQDGSDEKSTLARGESVVAIEISAHWCNNTLASHESVTPKGLPPLMSLMLLDSEKTQLLSEIVPLARSYDVSTPKSGPVLVSADTLTIGSGLECSCSISSDYSSWDIEIFYNLEVSLQSSRRTSVLGWYSCNDGITRVVDVTVSKMRPYSYNWSDFWGTSGKRASPTRTVYLGSNGRTVMDPMFPWSRWGMGRWRCTANHAVTAYIWGVYPDFRYGWQLTRNYLGMYELSPATCLHPKSSGSSRGGVEATASAPNLWRF